MAIQEHTLELAIIELNRCLKVLMKLRSTPKIIRQVCRYERCTAYNKQTLTVGFGVCVLCNHETEPATVQGNTAQHAAALRASMDATRILADLRQGR